MITKGDHHAECLITRVGGFHCSCGLGDCDAARDLMEFAEATGSNRPPLVINLKPRPQWSLLPASIASVVDVLTWSENAKHKAGEWRTKTATHHYDAAMRHLHAYRTGEKQDPDTKQHPLAHAVARLLFALAIEQGHESVHGHDKGEPK